MKKINLLCLFILVANLSSAQVFNFENISTDKKNIIQASIGLNMAVIGHVEYGRVLKFKEKLFVVSANIIIPMGEKIFDDGKVAINISGNTINYKNWKIPVHFGFFSTFTSNKMSSISTLGTQISISPGYYKKSWFVGSEITYDKFMLAYIKNSDFYREAYYSEALDGWYKNSGGNLHFGLIGGKTFSNNNEINLRVGIITTEKFNTTLVPYYALIGYKFIF